MKIVSKSKKKKSSKTNHTKSTSGEKWERDIGRYMYIKARSKIFKGKVTDMVWAGSMFLELDNGKTIINAHKIEYATEGCEDSE